MTIVIQTRISAETRVPPCASTSCISQLRGPGQYQLSCSDCQAWSTQEVLAKASDEERHLWVPGRIHLRNRAPNSFSFRCVDGGAGSQVKSL